MIKRLKKISEKYPIALFGLIVSLSYIVYIECFRDLSADISFSIQNDTNVFDVNEPIKDLEIKYLNLDLINSGQKLKVLSLQVENTGNVNITEGMYSSTEPFGFHLLNGKILQVPEIKKSPFDVSLNKLTFIDSLNKILLPKVLLDKGEIYEIQTLYLSEEDEVQLKAFGKISGIKDFNISFIEEKKSYVPPILIFLFLGSISLIILTIAYFEIKQYINRSSKRKLWKKFKSLNKDIELPWPIKKVFMAYEKSDFQNLENLLTNTAEFKKILSSDFKIRDAQQEIKFYDPNLSYQYDKEYCGSYCPYPLKNIISNLSGIFNTDPTNENDRELHKLNTKFVADISKFFEFLKHN